MEGKLGYIGPEFIELKYNITFNSVVISGLIIPPLSLDLGILYFLQLI